MRGTIFIIAALMLSSCEWDARRENMALADENEQLRLQLHLSTEYIEDVTEIIDQVQTNLQYIEDREGIIDRISLSTERPGTRAVNVRRQLMTSISDIDGFILDNRMKMQLLAERIRDSQIRIVSLEQLVDNLNAAVKAKEEDVERLKEQVNRLEENVASLQGELDVKEHQIEDQSSTIERQAQTIEDLDRTVREQEEAAATAFYVVDNRDELKRKGLIIEKRSGFLGLGRSTKVGTIAPSYFKAVPKSIETISFDSDVHDIEVVSAHKERPDLYTFERSDEGAQLTISNTEGFWALSEYLIIVASD